METITFHKLHSAGNDFIFIFNKENNRYTKSTINKICDRNSGIGADGVFIINEKNIVHYDPDGSESFCANGSLCLAYLNKNNFKVNENFTIDNTVVKVNNCLKYFSISFNIDNFFQKNINLENYNCNYVEISNPHLFVLKDKINIDELNSFGNKYVNHEKFKNGVNISFITKLKNNHYNIATYERGVNKITKCCGSACSAFALLLNKKLKIKSEIIFYPPSNISRMVNINNNTITLKGSANYVFKGFISIYDFNISVIN